MFTFIFFASLAALSAVGALLLVGWQILSLRSLSENEQKSKADVLPPFFDFVREDVVRPFEEFVAGTVRPAMFKIGEKFLRRFRLLVLRAEAVLHRLSDYFHGKRIAIKNGNGASSQSGNGGSKNSEFWGEMREFKNGPQNNPDNNKTKDSEK